MCTTSASRSIPTSRRGEYPSFKEVLSYIHNLYLTHKEQLLNHNQAFKNILNELEEQGKIQQPVLSAQPIWQALDTLEAAYDKENGGFGKAPKFPMVTSLELLLLNWHQGKNVKDMVLHTLRKMCERGLFDQVGGGFFRYSVDQNWHIPHFEKMLYDNGQLLALLTQVYSLSHQPFIYQAAKDTADWIIREMQSPEGGYYSTIAADSGGKEGEFYVWTPEEVKIILTEREYQTVRSFYGLDKNPNFKRRWHLQVRSETNMDPAQLAAIKSKLYKARTKRERPQRDEKIITSWNGLAIKALSLAGYYLEEDSYIHSAERAIQFIMKKMWCNETLFSVHVDNKLLHSANLDDYVFLIEGLVYFLQAKWDHDIFIFLQKLINQTLTFFEDTQSGGFYYTANEHEQLIFRIKQYMDESLPSANAIITRLLLQLGYLLGNKTYLDQAHRSLSNAYLHIKNYPDAYCSFIIALAYHYEKPYYAIVRAKQNELHSWQEISKRYFTPNRLIFCIDNVEILSPPLDSKQPEDEAIAYLCQGFECKLPIQNLQEFENELRTNQFRIAK